MRSVRRTTLDTAKKVSNDKWYTRTCEIAKELDCYCLEGKKVFLNCDTKNSNFFKYLHKEFNFYELKKLLAIGLDSNGIGQINSSDGKEVKTATIPRENGMFFVDSKRKE